MSRTDSVRLALPGYDVGRSIGRGGCGEVLAGTHLKLGRRVAIKQIPPQFAGDRLVRQRFANEARLMASVDHSNVAPIYDYVESDELCLLVMEFLPGGTVAQRFTKDGIAIGEAISIAVQCAEGLHAAHQQGVLHRDIKPANLMFAANGSIKITDFGIAKILGGAETLMTRAGDVVGTPSYIAPEQVRGQDVSPATDVYALSTTLYQLLSGRLPFPRVDDPIGTMFMHAHDRPTPLLEVAPTVPAELAKVVMRGLATEPSDRFSSALEFARQLSDVAVEELGFERRVREAEFGTVTGGTPARGFSSIGAAAVAPSDPTVVAPSDETVVAPSNETVVAPSNETVVAPSELTVVAPGSETVVVPGGRTVAVGDNDTTIPSAGPGAHVPTDRIGDADDRTEIVSKPRSVKIKPLEVPDLRSVDLTQVAPTDVAPVRKVARFQRPIPSFIIAAMLLVISFAIAIIGLESAPRGGDLAAGQVFIAGADPRAEQAVEVDTSDVIPVFTNVPGAESISLAWNVLGIDLGKQTVPLVPLEGGAGAAIEPPLDQYLLAGNITGHVWVTAAGREQSYRFVAHTQQRALYSGLGVGSAILFLFALAYIQSSSQSLLRGKNRISSSITLPISAAILAVAVMGGVWVGLGTIPTVATLAASTLAAFASGVAGVVGATRAGREVRYRRSRRIVEQALARKLYDADRLSIVGQ